MPTLPIFYLLLYSKEQKKKALFSKIRKKPGHLTVTGVLYPR